MLPLRRHWMDMLAFSVRGIVKYRRCGGHREIGLLDAAEHFRVERRSNGFQILVNAIGVGISDFRYSMTAGLDLSRSQK